jgi:hypothetical protein
MPSKACTVPAGIVFLLPDPPCINMMNRLSLLASLNMTLRDLRLLREAVLAHVYNCKLSDDERCAVAMASMIEDILACWASPTCAQCLFSING